ncbi:type II secretion system F family protein [Arthrobacter sp. ISL-85]|uniref:type II secretion system F family protein n=1 Tax=Arthrobacter sp. ISL-85 TaxID=2819115 RepID=UPI001BE5AAB5|nr:type II secretion system F family protein [Arthrobacter sp. ISL-85]MBT2567420.1 type II secretion system F family protein [Arthrobacter sp. ISL-85]
MDSPLVFIGAISLCFGALFILVLVVLRPRYAAIPIERRRPDGQPDPSTLSRFSESAANAMGGLIGKSGGPYSRDLLYNAGVKMTPAEFSAFVAAMAIAVGLLSSLLSNLAFGILLALATPFVARLVLTVRRDRRRSKFDAQLIGTIQMLIGGLRVGHSVMRTIEAAANESEAPTSEELSRIVNETRIGKDAREAIDDSASRMDSEDFRWIGQAIQINREVGGDLAEVLEQVAGTIRERSEIKGQVRALSGEGKMSAYILMALPVGVAFFVGMINPGYLDVLVQKPIGWFMLGLSALMFIIGGFWMSRIVKIKF